MTNENMVADIATGATYSQPVFAQLAEKAFPNQWDEPLHMALARSGGFQLAQEVYLPGRERIVTAENSLGIERQMLNIYNKPVLPPAVYSATKAGTLGLGLILAGAALAGGDWAWGGRALTILAILFVTLPVASHMLARAAARQQFSRDEIDRAARYPPP